MRASGLADDNSAEGTLAVNATIILTVLAIWLGLNVAMVAVGYLYDSREVKSSINRTSA